MKTGTFWKYVMNIALAALFALGLGYSSALLADEKEGAAEEVAEVEEDETPHHETAVEELVVKKGIPIPTSYIENLFKIPNAFGEGAACVICHSSNDPKTAYRGLDLTSCKGLLKGATEAPVRKVVVPGKPKGGTLRRFMRDNRMPLGVAFNYPIDTPNHLLVKKWIEEGAKDTNHFEQKILPLFAQKNAFGTEQPCTECHMSNQEPPSFHELDMTSYKGVMLGADAVAKAAEGKPPVKIVIPGKPGKSKLWLRLVENRMPAGIDASENRSHPNLQILLSWIKQGAKCN